MAVEPTMTDIEYARVQDRILRLDFYLSTNANPGEAPLILWIHGGAWRSGSKKNVPILGFLAEGFSIASVEYRLSPEAKFPSQIHDIKAAIRYIRKNASRFQVDPSRFIIAGVSAGGHLAALVGVSSGVDELEGNVATQDKTSSKVQAIISFFGASNLESILSQSTAHGLSVRVPALELLLGGQPIDKPELARLASPVAHVDASDPPVWMIHGDADPQMPLEQSEELLNVYEQRAAIASLEVVPGGVHGGDSFFDEKRIARLANEIRSKLEANRN
jgi:acetyl esterase/lipase